MTILYRCRCGFSVPDGRGPSRRAAYEDRVRQVGRWIAHTKDCPLFWGDWRF